jgi:hypothetical protein
MEVKEAEDVKESEETGAWQVAEKIKTRSFRGTLRAEESLFCWI